MKPARLIVRSADGAERTHEIRGEETLIGRTATSHVRLADLATSREHATISWERGRYVIEDLQTTNGTRVNGKRVRSAELSDGDEIQLGQTLIRFEECS